MIWWLAFEKKVISVLAGNLNSGRSYFITAVQRNALYFHLVKRNTLLCYSPSQTQKKILLFSCAHCCFCSCFFLPQCCVLQLVLWLPHSGTYQNILTVRPEQNLKSYKLDKIQQLNSMKINQTLVYNCLISNARISTNNTRFPRTNLTQTHACAEQK